MAGNGCGTGEDVREQDEAFMRQALALAVRGVGHVDPNPLVGALVVRDGRVVGRGWHAVYGGPHAERAALDDCARAGQDARGATVYVTLEPCAHHGKQPPCADALVGAGVARVVVGSRDPNPLVSGKGLARLEQAGVEVVRDVLREECDATNQVFFHYITTGRPYVLAKWAMSADGHVACRTGQARWVSGEGSRRDAHALRNRLAAVMVGVGTVRADDPLLTCRLEGGRNPLRVVCDTDLSIFPDSALVRSAAAGEAPLLVACGEAVGEERANGACEPGGSAGAGARGGACGQAAPAGAACELGGLAGPDMRGVDCGQAGPVSDVRKRGDSVEPGARGGVRGQTAPADSGLADVMGSRPGPSAPSWPTASTLQLACDPAAVRERAARLRELGVEVLELPRDARGKVDLRALMAALGARGVSSVLLEGGPHLLGAAFAAGLVDEAVAYLAPKLLGDALAPGPAAGLAPAAMSEALRFGRPHVDVLGDDVRLVWRVRGASDADGARDLPCVACGPLYPGGLTTRQVAGAASSPRDAKAGE